MSTLDPTITRCAKQIYRHLHLLERIDQLTRTDSLPLEIDKMKDLAVYGPEEVSTVVKKFLSLKKDKKTIGDFIKELDDALSSFMDDDEFDEGVLVALTDHKEHRNKEYDDSIHSNPISHNNSNNNNNNNNSTGNNNNNYTTGNIVTGGKRSSSESDMGPMKRLKPAEIQTMHSLTTPPASPLDCFSGFTPTQADVNVICSPHGKTKLLDNISWTVLYEIGRFIMTLKIPWKDLTYDAFQLFINTAQKEPQLLFQTMIRWNQEVRRGLALNGLAYTQIEKASDVVWSFHKRHSEMDSEDMKSKRNRMIHFNGIIHLPTTTCNPTIYLRPPRVNASNRLFRKFGQDRFLELKLGKSSHPGTVKYHKTYLLKPFLLMQRTFEFLFMKDNIMIFFATEGIGLKKTEIQTVIDWHMPLSENWNMTMSKYASRMTLGYSNSLSTLQFRPEQIEYIEDVFSTEDGLLPSDDTCMTDGCGIVSCQAMKMIVGCEATDELPCAIQGRIGGAKGIWIICPDLDFTTGVYIQIRKSQHKFITGIPQDDLKLDPIHYTFDLVKHSICVYPSFLNTQFIQCMSSGGVPTETFVDILKEYILRLATVVTENKNVKILRDWVAQSGSIMTNRWELEDNTQKGLWRDACKEEEDTDFDDESFEDAVIEVMTIKDNTYGKINKYSGIPASLHECVVRLLDAGFDLSNAFVATRVTNVFRKVMQNVAIKYKIELPQSCTLTCVPDPTHTLEADQIFLQLSSRRVDEKTGIRAGIILGDVVVTRNPCGLRSDIQKVRAVDCTALRMYTDIVIFSVKGKRALASKLSGGDYDGDIVFCSWDERIVKPFVSCEVPPDDNRIRDVFIKDNTLVGQEIGSHPNPGKALQEAFISVAIPDGTLGMYENWRTVLAEQQALEHPDVIYLAQMCARLVDAPKQGLALKNSVLNMDRNKFAHLPHPGWFMDKKNKQRPEGKKNYRTVNDVYTVQGASCVTTMDHLHHTLNKETAKFTQYSRNMFMEDDVPFKDPQITAPWLNALRVAQQDPILLQDLQLIEKTINEHMDNYSKQSKQYFAVKQHRLDNTYDPTKYSGYELLPIESESQFASAFEMEEYFAMEFHTRPLLNDMKSPTFLMDNMVHGGIMLQCIKASYAYILSLKTSKYSKYCYIVAYDAIRRIKADAQAKESKENGLSESVCSHIYKAMNLDRKWIKKLKESNLSEDPDKHEVRISPLTPDSIS